MNSRAAMQIGLSGRTMSMPITRATRNLQYRTPLSKPYRQAFQRQISPSQTRHISFFGRIQNQARVQRVQFQADPNPPWHKKPWVQRALSIILTVQILNLVAKAYSMRKESKGETPTIQETIKTVASATEEQKAGADAQPVPQDTEEEGEDVVIEIDDDDAWFIPLGWPKKKPVQNYKGTDEEWKQFQIFSQDQNKKDAVKAQAIHFIELVVKGNPALAQLLGDKSKDKPIRPTNHWLDIDYPTSYFDGYEITGFLITDDILAWASREYDPQVIDKFLKVISPIPLMQAVWNVTKQAYNGSEGFKTKMLTHEKLPFGMPGVPGVPDLSATPGLQKMVGASLYKLRKPIVPKSVPKGCVMVSGRIDIAGSKAWASFAILGFYNPEQNGWYEVPDVKLGAIRPLKLMPRG